MANDIWWCREGCGFVDKEHRCEQWTLLFKLPAKAIDELHEQRDELAKELAYEKARYQRKVANRDARLVDMNRENERLQAENERLRQYIQLLEDDSTPARQV